MTAFLFVMGVVAVVVATIFALLSLLARGDPEEYIRRSMYSAMVAIALLLIFAVSAPAQDMHHDTTKHDTFYRHLTRPDIPNSSPGSCCSGSDCYQTHARLSADGKWWALRREDSVWVEIPDYRVVTDPNQLKLRPDQRAVLCALPTFIYCFVRPETEG